MVKSRSRIAFVVPRFGENIVGGAELLAGELGARLLSEGHEVEIVTTCAVDHYTWENVLPEGKDRVGKLPVRRFRADGRDAGIHGELDHAISQGISLTRDEELLWLRNGICSKDMEDHFAQQGHRYDIVIPLPYLFGTTYFTYRATPDNVVPIGCLHDEPFAYLSTTKDLLEGSRGVIFNSSAEAELGTRLAPAIRRHQVVGMGFDPPIDVDPAAFRRKHRLKSPFILYVGRREHGKNTHLLIEYFIKYKTRNPGPLKLVLVGSGGMALPHRRDLIQLEIDWAEKYSMYAAADVFCQPSVNESFSIVLMQAWQAGTPALVHAGCDVTRTHCEQSNGGLWFESFAEFEAALQALTQDPNLRSKLGRAGGKFVERSYSWDAVMRRMDVVLKDWDLGEVPLGT